MGEEVNNRGFMLMDDGTIVRDADEKMKSMNKEILDIVEVSSYSHKVLAAYRARNIAYEICKEQYGKLNYEDYVEGLMRQKCPIEYEKAEIGKKYWLMSRCLMYMPFFFMFIIPIMIMLKKQHVKLCKQKSE